MNLVQIDLADRQSIGRVFKVILEKLEIAFVHLEDQVLGQIVKEIFDRMRALGAVAFALVEPRNSTQIDRRLHRHIGKHLGHTVIELLGPKDAIIPPPVGNEGRDMTRHRRPVNVGVHRLAVFDGVTREQQEPAEHGDLVEFAFDVDPIVLRQMRDQIAAIPLPISLDAADFVKERRQKPRVGIAHEGEGKGVFVADVVFNRAVALFLRPFVQPLFGVVDIPVVETAVIGIVHDLPNRRASALRHHAINHAFAFRHPCAGKSHMANTLQTNRPIRAKGPCGEKSKFLRFLQSFAKSTHSMREPTAWERRVAQIAYILLCHKNVASIVDQARRLTATGDVMAIHFDARASQSDYDLLRAELADNPSVAFPKTRLKCGWGEWSLVDATLKAIEAAVNAFPRATHFYMLSGDCMPIKTAEHTHAYLEQRDVDYIESYDFFESDWIKTGFKEERLIYRHWFNERTQAKQFYASFNLQKRLKLTRKVPKDIRMMIGSQWWCLRRQTVEAILEFVATRRDVVRFFRTTWIPDETFFQTLVRHLVPETEIDNRTLTFLMFSDYGMPVTFYNDHYDMLVSQDFLFARKISSEALELKSKLGELYLKRGVTFRLSDEGRRLFTFLTGQGRIGERFAPRFWEKDSTIGRERRLLIVTCKKWHVAKRLLDRIGSVSNMPAIEYLFDEEATPLPDLGGIQATLAKRTRHRRAMMRMLFDYFDTDQMLICLDPANLDLFKDFYSDRSETRLLEIDCLYTDDYLEGHAKRVGLAAEHTSPDTFRTLVPTIRNDVFREMELIRDQNFPEFHRIREKASHEENAGPLADFLGLDRAKALEIVSTDHLFVD